MEQLEPALVILSGPADRRQDVERALIAARFAPVPSPLPDGDGVQRNANHGLPSHPNVLAANQAGAPNSGHTPDTPHPDTGEAYEADPNIAWVTCASEDIDGVAAVAEPFGWRLRSHTSATLKRVERGAMEDRVKRIENTLGLRGGI